jgi:hypothetical protein
VTPRGDTPVTQQSGEQGATADGRRFAAATSRNREPLLAALRGILPAPPAQGSVLEFGSGTGEHAIFLAEHFPHLVFQPSDPDASARQSIAAWIAATGAHNVLPPLDLDAETANARDLGKRADDVRAVMAVNVIHISPWTTCLGLLRLAGELLLPGAPLTLYGPYLRGGRHTAASNEAFDQMLRSRDAAWGVRDLDEVASAAAERGFALDECIEMPANNLVVVFRK